MNWLEIIMLADWLVETCLLFGAGIATAYQVAGLFIEATDARRSRPETEESSVKVEHHEV